MSEKTRTNLTPEEIAALRRIESGGSDSRASAGRTSRGSMIRARVPINALHAEIIRAYHRARPTWSETTVYFVALRQLNRIRRLNATTPTLRDLQ